MTNKRSCKSTQIYRQTNRHKDIQTNRHTGIQSNRHTDRHTSGETPVTRDELHNKNSHNDKVEPGERRSSRRVFIGKKPADYSVGRINPASTAANTGNHTDSRTDRLRNRQTNSPQRASQTVSLNPRSTANVQTAKLDSSSLDKKPGTASGRSITACRSHDKARDTTHDTGHDLTRDSRRRLPSWLRKQWAFSKRLIYNLEIRNMRGLDRLIRNNHEQLRAARRAVVERRFYDREDTQTNRLTNTQTDRPADNDGLFDRKIEYFDKNFNLHD